MRAASGLAAWGALLVVSLTWPMMLPGEAFALRDMVVVPDMALTHASLGFGDLAARNVPQDAVLAVLPVTVLIVRIVVIGSASLAAYAGYLIGTSTFGRAAAMTVAVWNPFVVERLLQGQWSLAAAAWLMPFIAVTGSVLAMWVASLTPTGALAAACLSTSRRHILAAVGFCSPWVVAGVLSPAAGTASAESAQAFAPRAEAWVGTLGTLLGLGGMWNGEAVPPSRTMGFAVFGVVLFAIVLLQWRAVPKRLLILAGLGFAVTLLSWAGVVGAVIDWMPGAGLLRDAHKWLILALPAFVHAAGALRPKVAVAALACALLQVPDAPVVLAALRPAPVALPDIDAGGRDVFFVDRPALLLRADNIPVVDPVPKTMNVVESGGLSVDNVQIDPPSKRWLRASADPENTNLMRSLGIGLVVYPDGRIVDTGAPARALSAGGQGLLVIWFLVPLVALLPARRPLNTKG